jgi:predicted DNA-binding protein (UPF0278 family)
MDVYTQIHLALELIYHVSIVAWLYFLSRNVNFIDEIKQRLQTGQRLTEDRLHELENDVYTLQQQAKVSDRPLPVKRKIGPVTRKK